MEKPPYLNERAVTHERLRHISKYYMKDISVRF